MGFFERILRRFGFVKIQKIQTLALQDSPEAIINANPESLQLVSVPEIQLKAADGSDALTLKSIDYSVLPKNRSIVPMNEQQKKGLYSYLSSAAGIGANVGGQAAAVSGLYRATASASQLVQYADGTIGSMVMEGGKIAGHAGFTAAGAAALAPVAIFSVLSTVTGQYYMKDIQKQLNQLNTRIEQLIQKVEAKNRGALDAIYRSLSIIEKQRAYTMDDLVFIRTQSATALSLYYNYIEQLKIILSDDSIKRMMESGAFTSESGDVKKTRERFDSQNIPYLVQMANISYVLHVLSELVYFKELCVMSGQDASYLTKVQDQIMTLSKEMEPEHLQMITGLKAEMIPYLKKRAEEALIKKESLEQNKKYLESTIDEISGSIMDAKSEVGKLRMNMVKPFQEQKSIYYDLSNPDDPMVFIED